MPDTEVQITITCLSCGEAMDRFALGIHEISLEMELLKHDLIRHFRHAPIHQVKEDPYE